MEKEQLIVRKAHDNDRRLNLIYLTEKAKSYEKDAFRIVNEIELIATKGLSEFQIQNLKDAVRTIMSNIENR